MKKRIFYFNINYDCNNKCIFCYSHNTIDLFNNKKNLSFVEFKSFLKKNNVTKLDRVVLNGGEPLLHKEINLYLEILSKLEVETLIFTNGRMLKLLNPNNLKSNLRFIVPIHGNKEVHDFITGVSNSLEETLESLYWIQDNAKDCNVDIKIILNKETIQENQFLESVKTWESLAFNNALHITKMADTKVSIKNGLKSLSLDEVSMYTLKLYNLFKEKCNVKIYGSCIKSFSFLENSLLEKYNIELEMIYKDSYSERMIPLKKARLECSTSCNLRDFCLSEVLEYKVLEFSENKIYESVE